MGNVRYTVRIDVSITLGIAHIEVMTWHQLTATVPGWYRCGFLIPPADGAAALAAFVANCFTEALLPVDFFAVYFILAIMKVLFFNNGH